MSPQFWTLIEGVWRREANRTALLYQKEAANAHAKAAANPSTEHFQFGAATLLQDGLFSLLETKAGKLIEETRKVIESDDELLTDEDREKLSEKFGSAMASALQRAQIDLANLKAQVGGSRAIDRLAGEAPNMISQARHDFFLMVATASKKKTAQPASTTNIYNAPVFNGQVNFFRDLVTQIDTSNLAPAEKAEAKSKLSEFLSHPVITAVVGAMAKQVFETVK